MKLTLPKIRKVIFVSSLLVIAFFLGWWSHTAFSSFENRNGIKNISSFTSPRNVDLTLFWNVWDQLANQYFDKSKLNTQAMVYGAIKGMVSAIGDPYTVFLPPDEEKHSQEDLGGSFEGVGIEIGFKGSRLAVIAPLDGTPAQKAGIRAGDFIVGIKDTAKKIDESTVGMNILQAVDAIRGPAGSPVILYLTRDGVNQVIEKTIVRAAIDVPSVKLSWVGNDKKIAYLVLSKFGGNTEAEWNDAISKVKSSGARGMVLDLRNNPGGFLTGAIDVASDFIPSGVVVIQEDGQGVQKSYNVSGNSALPKIPLVVLVNSGSASASEIVSGALKDHKRATIVGEKTFGKGTIQEAETIGDSGLHITTAKWLTPNGTWVNEKGLEPDITVKNNPDTTIDEQLQKAIDLLK